MPIYCYSRTYIIIFALLTMGAVAQAQDTPTAASPAIVQKYVSAVAHTPSLTVQVSEVGAKDTAQLTMVGPNKISIRWQSGTDAGVLISNGKNVREWGKTQFAVSPAPATLAKLSPQMGMGVAAEIGTGLLTDSTSVTDYANLRDTGIVAIHGIRAHQVVSVEDGDTATFWLRADGLPVQAMYTGGRHNRTVSFRYLPVRAYASTQFALLPPPGLTRFVVPPTPKLLATGTPAPPFDLPRASGYGVGSHTLSLADLKGQVVLIDFWASWCRPCKKTMPHIQTLRETLGAHGLTVLSVNTWDTAPRMQKFLRSHPQYTSTFLFDGSPAGRSVASSKYHVWGIPTVYVIDKDGNIAGAFIGDDPKAAAQIEATLAKLGVI